MLNLTASMAVATKHLARTGFRPKGTLLYFAVADEEAGGHWGAEWALDHERDAVAADYVITESGGLVMDTQAGQKVTITVAEKGVMWRRLRVRGTPGHGSAPFGADNALVKAAEIVRRIAAYEPRAQILDLWENYVDAFDLTEAERKALRDPDTVLEACRTLPDQGVAKLAHACTHTTFSPNVAHGGVKTNVIPDVVDLDIDIRVLPGETNEEVRAHIDAALGDLSSDVEMSILQAGEYTRSPIDTPLYDALEKVAQRVYPQATLMPVMTVGGTDARFYRNAGSLAYGFGLMSPGCHVPEVPLALPRQRRARRRRVAAPHDRLLARRWSRTCSGEDRPARSPGGGSSSRGRPSRRAISSSGLMVLGAEPVEVPDHRNRRRLRRRGRVA